MIEELSYKEKISGLFWGSMIAYAVIRILIVIYFSIDNGLHWLPIDDSERTAFYMNVIFTSSFMICALVYTTMKAICHIADSQGQNP